MEEGLSCKYAARNEWGPGIDCDHPEMKGLPCNPERCPLKKNRKPDVITGIDTRMHRTERSEAVNILLKKIKEIYDIDKMSFEEEMWSADDPECPELGFNVFQVRIKFKVKKKDSDKNEEGKDSNKLRITEDDR